MSQTISFFASAIENNDLYFLPKLFDISYINKSKDTFSQIAKNPSLISTRVQPKFWADIVKNITNISLCDDLKSEENIHKAFQYFNQASILFILNQTEIDVMSAVYRSICKSCLFFSNYDKCYTDATSILRKLNTNAMNPRIRVQFKSNNPILEITNALVRNLLMKNNYDYAYKTFNTSQSYKIDLNSFTVSELASYFFLKGKVHMVYGERDTAYKELKKSLRYIPLECKKDRRLVLIHFIPISLSFGIVPTDELLNNYGLYDLYSDFVSAVSTGNLALFNEALNTHQSFLIHFGVWEMIVQSKRFVIRRILEMVKMHSDEWNNIRVEIESFRLALCLSGDEFSFEDAVLNIANLVYDKLLSANIAYHFKLVVFPSSGAFKLPELKDSDDDDE